VLVVNRRRCGRRRGVRALGVFSGVPVSFFSFTLLALANLGTFPLLSLLSSPPTLATPARCDLSAQMAFCRSSSSSSRLHLSLRIQFLRPAYYDPRAPTGSGFDVNLPSSTIPRMYHSTATLLADGESSCSCQTFEILLTADRLVQAMSLSLDPTPSAPLSFYCGCLTFDLSRRASMWQLRRKTRPTSPSER
jgi:hypothetical protein